MRKACAPASPSISFRTSTAKCTWSGWASTPLLTFSAAPDDEIRLLVKRATDIVLAGAGLILAAPVPADHALLIKLTSPGPVIFRQERCGLNGRRFTFYKFRSMCDDAEARKAEVMHLSQRELATKIPNDPRLTPSAATCAASPSTNCRSC